MILNGHKNLIFRTTEKISVGPQIYAEVLKVMDKCYLDVRRYFVKSGDATHTEIPTWM